MNPTCIAIAINLEKKFAIGNSIIGKGNPVYTIAEVEIITKDALKLPKNLLGVPKKLGLMQ